MLPYSLETEQAVLGNILFDNECASTILKLKIEDFYDERHQRIFDCMKELYEANKPIDIISVADKAKTKELSKVDLLEYLSSIQSFTTTNLEYYIEILIEKSTRRQIYRKCQEISQQVLDPLSDFTALELKNNALQLINDVRGIEGKKQSDEINDILNSFITELDRNYENQNDTSYYTGFYDLDKAIAGLHKGELTIIAARPSVGKTAFALQIAERIASNGKKVLFVSREMSQVQLVNRLVSKASGVDGHKIRLGKIADDDFDKISNAMKILSSMNLEINDNSGTVQEIRAKTREIQKKGNVDLIVIDYLQLLQTTKKFGSREQEVSSISRELKLMTLEFNIPIIALSQLNREASDNKEPVLSNLRESGAIEQDADNVLFLHKPDADPTNTVHDISIIIAKQRNGPIGKVRVGFYTKTMTFVNYEFRQQEPQTQKKIPDYY